VALNVIVAFDTTVKCDIPLAALLKLAMRRKEHFWNFSTPKSTVLFVSNYLKG
jgi:hypothetical protein